MSAVTGLTGYTDYSALNGIAGTYSGGINYSVPIFNTYSGLYGYYYGMDVDDAKENLQNNYDLSTLQQSYNNKQSVQTLDWSQLCANISTLLQQGRTDDAIIEYNKLTKSMSEASQYQGYNDSQIKALAQKLYAQTMGTNLVDDIDANSSSSFVQGLKAGVPIFGTFFAQGNSKEDMISEVTGVNRSAGSSAAKATGTILSGVGCGAAAGAGIGALFGGIGALPGAIVGGIIGCVLSVGKLVFGQ